MKFGNKEFSKPNLAPTQPNSARRSDRTRSDTSRGLYGFRFNYCEELEQFDFSSFNPYDFGGLVTNAEIEDYSQRIKQKLGKQLYSKRYFTNKLTYALIFLIMIAVAVLSVLAILNGSRVQLDAPGVPSDSQDSSTSAKEGYSEIGIILSIVVCVVCLIIALVVSSQYFKRDSKRTEKRNQLLDEIEKNLNESGKKKDKKVLFKFIKNRDVLLIYPEDAVQ